MLFLVLLNFIRINMKCSKLFKFVLIWSILLLSFQSSYAQCDPMFDPFCEDVDVPLDDWIPYVLIVCVAFTIYLSKRERITAKT